MWAAAPGPGFGPGAALPPGSTVSVEHEGAAAVRLERLDEDQRVVDAVLGGDRDAFRAIVEREAGTMIAACARILGDRAEAEDAAQEAFVIAYRSLATWRGEGPLGGWLVRIAVRIALRRASGRRVVAWIDPRPGAGATDEASPFARPSASSDPAVLALHTERDAVLRRAVGALDDPYREVVALRFFGDRSLAEIADLTGRPLGTVKTHLHRGLARLRQAVEGELR